VQDTLVVFSIQYSVSTVYGLSGYGTYIGEEQSVYIIYKISNAPLPQPRAPPELLLGSTISSPFSSDISI
jgi:hypothetical protein